MCSMGNFAQDVAKIQRQVKMATSSNQRKMFYEEHKKCPECHKFGYVKVNCPKSEAKVQGSSGEGNVKMSVSQATELDVVPES